ncbi:MAG: fructose-6-phosphate aldolase [Rickettsiales bacterium]
MKIFADTAEVEELKKLNNLGLVDGVTTNPSLIAKSGADIKSVIKEICSMINGPVSAEVIATNYEAMLKEAEILQKIASNVVIKLPITLDGLKACKTLTSKGMKTNMTLCFSVNQALLAAKAGASFVSPFIGRLEDIGEDGMGLIDDIVMAFANYKEIRTEVLVASIRNTAHVESAAVIGAHAATLPPKIIYEMAEHKLTDQGLDKFLQDWKKTGKKIV